MPSIKCPPHVSQSVSLSWTCRTNASPFFFFSLHVSQYSRKNHSLASFHIQRHYNICCRLYCIQRRLWDGSMSQRRQVSVGLKKKNVLTQMVCCDKMATSDYFSAFKYRQADRSFMWLLTPATFNRSNHVYSPVTAYVTRFTSSWRSPASHKKLMRGFSFSDSTGTIEPFTPGPRVLIHKCSSHRVQSNEKTKDDTCRVVNLKQVSRLKGTWSGVFD